MGSIRRVIDLEASAEVAWVALRDWQRLYQVLVPGFATGVVVEGQDRVVTFASGNVLRERIIDVDDDQRRLVWTIVDGPYAHHNGAARIIDSPPGQPGCRFEWISDVLPEETTGPTAKSREAALAIISHGVGLTPPDSDCSVRSPERA